MRFTDFLRVSVLLFGGAGTALAAVAVVGATRDDDTVLILAALGWWTLAVVGGLWFGRKAPSPGIGEVLASARTTHSLPELEPGVVLFNRMWPLTVLTIGSGAVAFLVPQVPAIAAGYAIGSALTWRKQSAAVQAIEDRDGVRFYFDRSSPFGPPKLLRTPWARKIEPAEAESEAAAV
jgi:hypothetical protein